jgi:hypothetical protein
MRPEIDQSLVIDFEELFALKDRIGQVADQARVRLLAAGITESFETEVMEEELELRGTTHPGLVINLDSYHLEIAGAPPELPIHKLAAILLDEAGAFRLTAVEMSLGLTIKLGRDRSLALVHQAFSPTLLGEEPMLDRRLNVTWDWGNAITGYSFLVADVEDRELYLGLKAREGYMTAPELEKGDWMTAQAKRFDALVERFFRQLGWHS